MPVFEPAKCQFLLSETIYLLNTKLSHKLDQKLKKISFFLYKTSPVVKLSKFGGSIGTLPQSESSLCQTYGSINGTWSFVSSKSGAQLGIDWRIRKRKNFQPMGDQRQDDKEV